MIKKIGKSVLCSLLERQAKKLIKRNDFKIVAVGGSVGKTSTKLAIAKTLSVSRRVIYQEGNYNDRLTVPLVLFGEVEPGIFNIFAWAKILARNQAKLRKKYPYDVAVLEIGTDAPGQMEKFSYLQPDIYVLTSIADEHMEYFQSLDAVAEEELQPVNFSKKVLLNVDDTPGQYLPPADFVTYGAAGKADFRIIERQIRPLRGQLIKIGLPDDKELLVDSKVLGGQGAKLVVAAVAVAKLLGLSNDEISRGLRLLTPIPGRMQILRGIKGSKIIDDTYNASPIAVKAALAVLLETPADKRIAILGSMNELGKDSQAMHEEIGKLCDPAKLNLLITIGQQAKDYLAPAAAKQGCEVKSFLSPYEAGDFAAGQIVDGTVVLAKGSQNGVFAEESLKPLLAKPEDSNKLVRQSDGWMKRKRTQFS